MPGEENFFFNPVRVYFGAGCRDLLLNEVKQKKCIVVTSARGQQVLKLDPLLKWIFTSPNNYFICDVTANPTINYLSGVIASLDGKYDAVIAIGGGSVIDVAKVISSRRGGFSPFIDGMQETSLGLFALPLYVIPTTAGSGSEVTPYAAIWDDSQKKKYSLEGPDLFPTAAYVDSELSFNLPQSISISCGLDAINQASESIWNLNATAYSMDIASRALKLGFDNLPKLIDGVPTLDARDGMSRCSLLSGLAISVTKTALCHSISYPLTAHFGVPHGLACAFTMPRILERSMAAEPNRFFYLSKLLCDGKSSLVLLQKKYEDMNNFLNVEKKVMEYVGRIDNILALKDQMITIERASNSLFAVDVCVIESILVESCKKA